MERITVTSTGYHMRYYTFSLSLAWFGGYLQRVTTRCRQIYLKNVYQHFLKKLTVTRGKPLQIAPKPY